MWEAQHQPNRSYPRPGQREFAPRPFTPETTLKTETLVIERKTFTVSLRENDRGRFLRITEDVGGWRNMIIVPSGGIDEFQKALHVVVEANK